MFKDTHTAVFIVKVTTEGNGVKIEHGWVGDRKAIEEGKRIITRERLDEKGVYL